MRHVGGQSCGIEGEADDGAIAMCHRRQLSWCIQRDKGLVAWHIDGDAPRLSCPFISEHHGNSGRLAVGDVGTDDGEVEHEACLRIGCVVVDHKVERSPFVATEFDSHALPVVGGGRNIRNHGQFHFVFSVSVECCYLFGRNSIVTFGITDGGCDVVKWQTAEVLDGHLDA